MSWSVADDHFMGALDTAPALILALSGDAEANSAREFLSELA